MENLNSIEHLSDKEKQMIKFWRERKFENMNINDFHKIYEKEYGEISIRFFRNYIKILIEKELLFSYIKFSEGKRIKYLCSYEYYKENIEE